MVQIQRFEMHSGKNLNLDKYQNANAWSTPQAALALSSSGHGDTTLLPQTQDCTVICCLLHHISACNTSWHRAPRGCAFESGWGWEKALASFKSPCFHTGDAQSNTGHPKEKTDQITHPVNAMPKQKPKRWQLQPRPELWHQHGTREDFKSAMH